MNWVKINPSTEVTRLNAAAYVRRWKLKPDSPWRYHAHYRQGGHSWSSTACGYATFEEAEAAIDTLHAALTKADDQRLVANTEDFVRRIVLLEGAHTRLLDECSDVKHERDTALERLAEAEAKIKRLEEDNAVLADRAANFEQMHSRALDREIARSVKQEQPTVEVSFAVADVPAHVEEAQKQLIAGKLLREHAEQVEEAVLKPRQ